ncbi:MAG: CHAP domain-containing protein [Clostridiales Family XIII bacterium]|nr:CHAP domain-containing protein [Clostridiales Family XIII bacterium]
MSLIRLETAAARAIRDGLVVLNTRQDDLFGRLNGLIDAMQGAWSGDIADAASLRLDKTRSISAAITEDMARYFDALNFAIQEMEEADRRAAMDKNVGQRVANVTAYTANGGKKGQCVWYVRNRAEEKNLNTYGISGDANTWWRTAETSGLPTGQDIRADSIACFVGGAFGHVVYVEDVIGDTVYYTEANLDGDGKISADDGMLKKTSVDTFKGISSGWKGLIYL